MNGPMPKARCAGCNLPRQVTVAGFIRSHRKGQSNCPGAGQPPAGPATVVAKAQPQPGTRINDPAPTAPTWGRSCDAGACNAPSVGWRLYRGRRDWLPVCGLHMGGMPSSTRVFDRDLPGGGQ